jgi:hypothetical protein
LKYPKKSIYFANQINKIKDITWTHFRFFWF